MEPFDYIETARATQLDLARAYRKAQLTGTVKGRNTTSVRNWFSRLAFRNARTHAPGASQRTAGGEA